MNEPFRNGSRRSSIVSCNAWVAAFLLAGFGATVERASAEVGSGGEEAALRASVQIVSASEDTRRTGTGVVIGEVGNDWLILTANHVLPRNGEAVTVRFHPYDQSAPKTESLKAVGRSSSADLAVALVPQASDDTAFLDIRNSTRALPTSFEAVSVGCRNGAVPTVKRVHVLEADTVVHRNGEAEFWLVEPHPSPGCSGGPLVDRKGHLIGIGCGITKSSKGAYAHLREIENLLRSAGVAPAGNKSLDAPLTVGGGIAVSSPPEWVAPAEYYLEVPLDVDLSINRGSALPFPSPLTLEIVLPSDVELVEGSTRLSVDKPGPIDAEVTVGLKLQRPRALNLTIECVEEPAWMDKPPEAVDSTVTIKPPPPIITMISADVLKVGEARWIDLVEGVANVGAEIRLNVEGPVADGSTIAVAGPPGIRSMRLSPDTVRRGKQVVELEMDAALTPSRTSAFSFELTARSDGAIDLRSEGPFTLSVAGPEPVRLILSYDGRKNSRPLEAELPPGQSQGTVSTIAAIIGDSGEASVPDIECVLGAAGDVELGQQGRLQLFQETTITLIAVDDEDLTSFFKDVNLEGEVTISPNRPCAAIVGSTNPVRLRRTAPFKKVLVAALVVVFLGVVIYVPFRFLGQQASDLGEHKGQYELTPQSEEP